MTTPKNQKPVYTNQPNYMFPDLQGLPEEFRRLAAESARVVGRCVEDDVAEYWEGKSAAWSQAAQMLEERLNGA